MIWSVHALHQRVEIVLKLHYRNEFLFLLRQLCNRISLFCGQYVGSFELTRFSFGKRCVYLSKICALHQ